MKRRLSPFLIVLCLAACVPANTPVRLEVATAPPTAQPPTFAPLPTTSAPLAALEQTQVGITLRIVEVHYSQFATLIRVQAELEAAQWPGMMEAFPLAGTQYYALPLVDDSGREYLPKAAGGGTPRLDSGTGKIIYGGELEFEPVAASARTLTLRTPVDLFNVPVSTPLSLDLRGKAAGDEWPLHHSLSVGGVPFMLQTARLDSVTDIAVDGHAQLRVGVINERAPVQGGLRLTCVSALPLGVDPLTANIFEGCEGGDENFAAKSWLHLNATVSADATPWVTGEPLELQLRASVSTAQPFTFTFPIQREASTPMPVVVTTLPASPPPPTLTDTPASHDGITFTLLDAMVEADSLIVSVRGEADLSHWGVTRANVVPQVGIGFLPEITGLMVNGELVAGEGGMLPGEGLPVVNWETGTAVVTLTHTFTPPPAADATLELRVAARWFALPANQTVPINLAGRKVNDVWEIGSEIKVWGHRILLERAQLVSSDDTMQAVINGQAVKRLELHVTGQILERGPLELRCLHAVNPFVSELGGCGRGDRTLDFELPVSDFVPLTATLTIPAEPIDASLTVDIEVPQPFILLVTP